MDTRNVTVTLQKAKEWYNSGNATLKEVALQAFTEEELRTPEWQNIKTFKDAYKALGIKPTDIQSDLTQFGYLANSLEKHLKAIYKLDIIGKALNGNWEPNLVEGYVYYPWVRFMPYKDASASIKAKGYPTFMYKGIKYTLVGGDCHYRSYGLGDFSGGDGCCSANAGLFGCKSKEIALHMSEHFTKEVFLACYADKLGDEIQWL